MGLLLSCRDIGKSFGARALFSGITLGLYEGDRAGMFGPNGAGKSTFLKILAGREHADEGSVEPRRNLRVGYLAQIEQFTEGTPREELMKALEGEHLEEQEKMTRVAIMLTKIGFDGAGEGGGHGPEMAIGALSGGWRKRLALARELVLEPELLLLDEPTNHLDLEGILWLEGLLKGANFAFLVVTHDRYFLDNVTTRIVEINPMFAEGFLSVPGDYEVFLERRAVVLEAQLKEQQTLKQKVKEEIAWLKRGPKAQRTKNKSRITDAHALIEEFAEMRGRTANDQAIGIDFTASERKTKKLLAAHNVVKSMGGEEDGSGGGGEKGGRLLINKMNLILSPGMKLGVLGPNGSGKSTLLKLMSGELEPDMGTIKRAPNLRVVMFDQQRKQLEKGQLLRHALSPDSDSVFYGGQLVHVTSYAKRFLFRHEQLDRPVGELSGGEQARVLIARLMLSMADLLILDEPTNDLDIPSLEVLEQSLEEFPGALVLVTHDRFMLDRLATEIVGLDGEGGHGIFADYEQYQNWVAAREVAKRKLLREEAARVAAADAGERVEKRVKKKLTLGEQKELDGMEGKILAAEEEVQKWHKAMEEPATMADRVKMARVCEALHEAQERVAGLYGRWEELEGKLAG